MVDAELQFLTLLLITKRDIEENVYAGNLIPARNS
jgi:hypothetical protein